MPRSLPARARSLETWSASSRVGATISACGLPVRQLGVVGVVRGDAALQHRDAEGQGLAGAGAGLADQVGAQQGDREGHLLDGEGGGDAGALERVADLGEHPELSEGGQDLAFAFGWSSVVVSG